MRRITEPELMLDPEQALAYAAADFSESDDRFVRRFTELFGLGLQGGIVDLGCGPGNITFRMAAAYPACTITGVDGSGPMLDIGRERREQNAVDSSRVRFLKASLQSAALEQFKAIALVSNSLLHHLHDPAVLWQAVKQAAVPGASVLIADLRRPKTAEAAQDLVDVYAKDAPEILRSDFFNSLLAAFEVGEARRQLDAAGLAQLHVESIGDRHLEISGRLPTSRQDASDDFGGKENL